MHIYLEYIHESHTFAPAKPRKRLMNQTLHILNRTCRKVRLHKGTDSQQTVHVHWFSGFI